MSALIPLRHCSFFNRIVAPSVATSSSAAHLDHRHSRLWTQRRRFRSQS